MDQDISTNGPTPVQNAFVIFRVALNGQGNCEVQITQMKAMVCTCTISREEQGLKDRRMLGTLTGSLWNPIERHKQWAEYQETAL